MQKFLAVTLAILITSSVSVQSAAASIRNFDGQVANLALQPELEADVTASSIEPVTIIHAEITAAAPDGQAAPTSTPTPPAHHGHHVRNFIIFAVALTAGLLLFAVAAGKS